MKAHRIQLVHRALASAAEVASITVARDGMEALKLVRLHILSALPATS